MKATHFPALKSALDSGRLRVEPELAKEPTKYALEKWVDLSDHAICFNLGDFFQEPEYIQIDPDKVQLPFDVCWFETAIGDGALLGALCTNVFDDGGDQEFVGQIFFAVFAFRPLNGWHLLGQGFWDRGPSCTFGVPPGKGERNATAMLGIVGRALTALACDNIEPIEHKPSVTRKAIAKSRQLPAFSTWTLQLRLCKEKTASLGGSHRSPRLHLRRGHIRQYKPGHYTWVSPCAVGNPDSGAIDKDYSLSF